MKNFLQYIKENSSSKDEDIITLAKSGKIKKLNELIKNGVDLNITDKEGNTALMWAIRLFHLNIVEKLINSGANIFIKNNIGNTALILAAINENLDAINLLIVAGADWHIKNMHNKDFFDYLNYESESYAKDIIVKYPEKYKEYLIKKEAEEKYNL